jgi:hypothetical protein
MLTTVFSLPRPHLKTSVTGSQWTRAEDKPEFPDILILSRDLVQNFWPSLVDVDFSSTAKGIRISCNRDRETNDVAGPKSTD